MLISPFPEILFFHLFVFSFLGAVLGSFASAIIYRIPRGQSWIWEPVEKKASRSCCPHCEHELAARDLIPILSWFFQKGRCRYCGVAISIQYFLLESFSLFTALGIYKLYGYRWEALFLLMALPFVLSFFVLLIKERIFSKQLAVIAAFFLFLYFLRLLS